MTAASIAELPIIKVNRNTSNATNDILAIEEPLEIRLEYGEPSYRKIQNVSVTMRTPGSDEELALGFLFTEGIIQSRSQVEDVSHCFIACAENKENVIEVKMKPGFMPDLKSAERNFYTTSSCGVCGKSSINAIRTVMHEPEIGAAEIAIDADLLYRLPELLRSQQQIFSSTGGFHASALFSLKGDMLMLREDVGRHNALDKLIGAALEMDLLPLQDHVLLLSGRISFELVQKTAMAGIRIIAAIGAPSSLAVQLAEEFNITLVGFLRNERFNIYTGPDRIIY